MANEHHHPHQLYGLQKSVPTLYTAAAAAARSAIDKPYFPSQPPPLSSSSFSSLYPESFYYPSSTVDRYSLPSSAAATASAASRSMLTPSATTSTTSLWPSFDFSSSLSKRPSQALYDYSGLGTHSIGQNEAWLTSDSLYKRPRLESANNLPVYPQRPGEKDCSHYMLTRTCNFGDACKFDHPIWVPAGGIPDWKEPPSIPFETHPERPGAPDCPYFVKTQKCKFGLNCKFNHPKDNLDTSGKTDASSLPERPSEPLCSFYMKTGICKFGQACKFHHPKDAQVPSVGDVGVNGVQDQSVGNLNSDGDNNSIKTLISTPALSYNSKGLPVRTGEVDCPFYIKTGSCKFGANCRYNHPDRNAINPIAAITGHAVLPSLANFNGGLANPAASILQSLQPGLSQTMPGQVPVVYPQRPGHIECDYYMKTGECKFGDWCKYHHPVDRSAPTIKQALDQNVKLTLAGLPRREGVQHCPFYMKTSTCSYGVNCKFDHPPPAELLASVGNEASKKDEVSKENEKNEENGEE